MKRPSLCFALLMAASCADFPRDPEGTLDRVRGERSYRVGLVAPLQPDRPEPKVGALLERVSRAAGARPRLESGDAEPLLIRLKEGELDLVIGRFEAKSPWKRLVSFGPALRVEEHGKAKIHLIPAMRNGENAWISLIEREAREIREPSR